MATGALLRQSGGQGALIGYVEAMKKINSTMGERLDSVRKLALLTAKEMTNDFRAVQLGEGDGTKPRKATNNAVSDAIAFAQKHKDRPPVTRTLERWKNRSSRAARGVHAGVYGDENEIAIRFSHGIYYGAYLEYAHDGRFAVLEPLMRKYAPIFIKRAAAIMGGNVR